MTVAQTIIYARICQYLAVNNRAKLAIFENGNIPTQDLPQLIYMVRKSVEYQYNYDYSNIIQAVSATATITIVDVGNDGDTYLIQVNDPILGLITLANYTFYNVFDFTFNPTFGGRTKEQIANDIATLINTNGYNYVATVLGNVITIIAPLTVGAEVNGQLIVHFNSSTFDYTFDYTFNNN